VARDRGIDVALLTGTGPGGRIITADVLDAAAAYTGNGVPGQVISPLVRRDAATAGVDLGAVSGTGPGGKVLRSDVQAAAAGQAPDGSPAAPLTPLAPAQVIPLTGMRGVIASRMQASLQEMAQLTLGTDATMDAAMALRAQLKEQWQQAGMPVPTITDLVVRAAALALRDHPRLNASVHEGAIHVQPEINVGLAVALEEGLMVPVLKRADQLPLSSLAAESRRLARGARDGRLALAELEGGTFTVSTLGSYGIDFFTPVITPGQVAILGVGRLRDSVRWEGTTPVRTQVLTLSITFDHRAVDGAPAADYLRSVTSRLARPLSLLA
jgi:pyruvate/2-oxoglutarate dehydrogenase complex dihydrolipoamide acyltransferase (E2) component